MQRDTRRLLVAMQILCVSDCGDFMVAYTCQNRANCHLTRMQSTILEVRLHENRHMHSNKGIFFPIRPQAG